MKIGVIGVGAIGSAIADGMESLGHSVIRHDIRLKTNITIIKEAEVVFICVPTNSNQDGSVNMHIVNDVVDELNHLGYEGIICVKSTSKPGNTKMLMEKYSNLKICYVPEFLRERCAYDDFIYNHDLLLIGSTDEFIIENIKKIHKHLPKKIKTCTTTEAEFVKYFSNNYNALRISFANYFYELCKLSNVNYDVVLENYLERDHNLGDYLGCNENLRGYGGMCLPKDVKAIVHFANEIGLNLDLMKTVDLDNQKVKITVFDGMRK